MKIGIDCRTVLNPGFGEDAGVGHYTYFLVKNILCIDQENEYVLFFDKRAGQDLIKDVVGGRNKVTIKFFPFHEYKEYLPIVYSHLLVSNFIKREGCDVYHSPSGHLPYVYSGKSILTVHDLAIFKHPEWFNENFLERFSSTRILLPKSVKTAKFIISPSESTKNDIHEIFKISMEKIEVIPHGVYVPEEVEFNNEKISLRDCLAEDVKSKYHLGEKYFLFLGTIEPRKNIVGLVKAFYNVIKENKSEDIRLVIAGKRGWKTEEIFDEIRKVNKITIPRESVRYLGYISNDEKFILMKNALAFVFPSLYEGFGLPVLESMALGTPVITSRISSLPEVTGESGLLINPNNEIEISDAMLKILNDVNLREKLSILSIEQAKKFSWMQTAERTLEIYKRAANIV